MKRTIIAFLTAVSFLTIVPIALSQEKPAEPPAPTAMAADPVTITVPRQVLLTIGQALQELPAKTANPILNDLQAQLNAADKAATDKAAEAAKKVAEPPKIENKVAPVDQKAK